MSTSDQQGSTPLTRKQLREIRLTGATPVISPEEAATPAPPLPRAAEPIEVPPAPTADDAVDLGSAPLTRRQAREQERIRTASVPVVTPEGTPVVESDEEDTAADEDLVTEAPTVEAAQPEPASDDAEPATPVVEVAPEEPVDQPEQAEPEADEPGPEADQPGAESDQPGAESEQVEEQAEPVLVSAVPAFPAAVSDAQRTANPEDEAPEIDAHDAGDADEVDGLEPADEHRPLVSPAFGEGVFGERPEGRSFSPSFDELITADSTGSQHIAPNTLIFTPSPGDGSLSGPVASTGEVLVTGSYELPAGLGSQGHARGTADGKDIDAILIDGELPPASSPTPIAASSAVSTIKPAGEVIRPPAPEKGNKLMFTLAITAGGLALALAIALIVAFATNVF